MKRFIALFLTLAVLLSLCPTTVWADEQAPIDEQAYMAEEAEEMEGTSEETQEILSETLESAISTPLAYSASPVLEARWGFATGEKADQAPTSWTYGTLTNAVVYANGLEVGVTYIQLLSDVDTTASLEFASGKTTILDLNGYDIDRGLTAATDNGYVIAVRGNLTLCDSSTTDATKQGKITGGYSSRYGGGVYVDGTFTMSGGTISENSANSSGGGVEVGDGTFTMNGGSISGNTANYYGGGVHVENGSTFTMNDGTISGNTADIGGGVYVYAGTFTMNDGTISGNTADIGGGVDVNTGTFTMNDGSISNNTADGSHSGGGGVYVSAGTFTMNGGTISGNTLDTASASGGGVYVSGTFTMNGGTISRNTVDNGNSGYGGGVYSIGNFTMNGGTISGNTSRGGGGISVKYGTFTMNGGTISGNTVQYGGGVHVNRDSTFTMNDGTISGNTARSYGGGVADWGSFTMNGGTISENTSLKGSGVDGAFTMNGGTISRNTGEGVRSNGTFTMNDGTISGNTSRGVYVEAGTFILNDGAIFGNSYGGVYLYERENSAAIFIMNGGVISGNNNEGVYVPPDATMQISGAPIISGNVRNGTLNSATGRYELGETAEIRNVCLYDSIFVKNKAITVVGALQAGAVIGVSKDSVPTWETPVAVAVGGGNPAYTLTANDAAKFTSDNGYLVELDSTNNKLLLTAKTEVKGDVNLDGEVNADDLTALARHVAKIETLSDPYALLCADVDDNDVLSADDLTKLARYVAKIIPSL